MEKKEKFAIFYDNSNIYISAQAYSGKIKNLRPGIKDSQCRVQADKLIEILLRNRSPSDVLLQKAYGQMSQEVISNLKKKGFDFDYASSLPMSKGERKGEKEADTQLTADGVELVTTYTNKEDNVSKTLILFSGDKDMCPLVRMARKYNWNVEVCAFKHSMNKEFYEEQNRKVLDTSVRIVNLEESFSEVASYAEWDGKITENTTLAIKFINMKSFFNDLKPEVSKKIAEEIKNISNVLFQLPIESKFLNGKNNNDELLAVVIILPDGRFYEFKKDVLKRKDELRTKIQDYLCLNFGRKDVEIQISRYGAADGSSSEKQKQNSSAPSSSSSAPNDKTKKISYKVSMCKKLDDPGHLSSPDGRTCKFAHTKNELRCHNCNVNGTHEMKDCRVPPKIDTPHKNEEKREKKPKGEMKQKKNENFCPPASGNFRQGQGQGDGFFQQGGKNYPQAEPGRRGGGGPGRNNY